MIELNQVVFSGRVKVGGGLVASISAKDKRVQWLLFNDGFIDVCVSGKRKLIPMTHVQEIEPVVQSDPRTPRDPMAKARAAKAAKRAPQPSTA